MKILFFKTGRRLDSMFWRSATLTMTLAAVILSIFHTSIPQPVFSVADECIPLPVIDAGHGGPDGGAVSAAGIAESGINLDIALKLELILRLYGIPPYMTRREDISLHSDSASTLREKKISDLKNRAAIINSLSDVVLMSIHQNSFTDPRYSGAQVFYSQNEDGKKFSFVVQDYLRAALDPSNARVPASSAVYLMEKAQCPAIIAECGFLSNAQEAMMLTRDNYQNKIAAGIAAAYLCYYVGGGAIPQQEG